MAGKKYVKKVTKKYTKKSPAKKTSGMGAELQKLKRQVSRLTKVAINKIQYQNSYAMGMSTTAGLVGSYDARALMKFGNWSRVFGTDADDEVNKVCLIRGLTGRITTVTNEPSGRDYSIWVVQLKDNASDLLQNPLTSGSAGDLAPLTQGTHYVGNGANVLLNLKYFKVHHHRARHLGIQDAYKTAVSTAPAVQTISTNGEDMTQLGSFRLNLGKGIRVSNPSGDWKAGGYPKDPSQNYYFLVFSSADSNADLEYGTMYVNTLVSVEVSG